MQIYFGRIFTNAKGVVPLFWNDAFLYKNGGYLLSHLRSTIGVTGLNFSVRDGKRWNPRAITALYLFFSCTGVQQYAPAV